MANADIPGAVTIVDREWSGIVMMLTCSVVVLAALGLVNAPAWVRHGDTAAVVAYAVAVVIALASACARAWRMQLRIDEDGVTIRNFYRMHRIGWSEIGQFEDGSRWLGWEASEVWALRVVCRNGQAAVSGMGSHPGWRAARPREMLVEAVRQAAAEHGVPAELTGRWPQA